MEYKCVIDRFEGKKAVLEFENRQMGNVPKSILPKGVKEGSSIVLSIKETKNEKKIDIDEFFK